VTTGNRVFVKHGGKRHGIQCALTVPHKLSIATQEVGRRSISGIERACPTPFVIFGNSKGDLRLSGKRPEFCFQNRAGLPKRSTWQNYHGWQRGISVLAAQQRRSETLNEKSNRTSYLVNESRRQWRARPDLRENCDYHAAKRGIASEGLSGVRITGVATYG
jgi:hypothetical protein